MSFFGLLFTGLFIWFAYKLIVRLWAFERLRRRWRDMVNGAVPRPEHERRGGWSSEGVKPHKKHIRSDEGEYVAFEEIDCRTTERTTVSDDNGSAYSSATTEETRVTDVEWEDLPGDK